MKTLLLAITVLLPSASVAQGGCDATFAPDTVKPSLWQSVKTVIGSFDPKGEGQRLSDLQAVVRQIESQKKQLIETLQAVSTQNSVPSWLEARVHQIPEIETNVAALLWKMHAEADQGGLFQGDPSFRQLSAYVDDKTRQLNQLCLLSNGPLPLSPGDKQRLDDIILDLQKEVNILDQIDTELSVLIKKANDTKKTG